MITEQQYVPSYLLNDLDRGKELYPQAEEIVVLAFEKIGIPRGSEHRSTNEQHAVDFLIRQLSNIIVAVMQRKQFDIVDEISLRFENSKGVASLDHKTNGVVMNKDLVENLLH